MSEVGSTIMSVEASWEDLVAESLPGIIWSTDTALRIATCQGTDLARISARLVRICAEPVSSSCFEPRTLSIRPSMLTVARCGANSCPITFTLSGIPFRGLVSPIQSAGKTVGGVMVAFALPTFEARYATIADTTADLILFLRPDGTIEEVNRTATGSPRSG